MMNMKTKQTLCLCIMLFASRIFAQNDEAATTILKAGDYMPAFTVQSISGKTFSSTDLNGKVVLINFWATWCPPCRAELPLLQKNIYDKLKDKNFAVLAISRGEVKDTVQKFIEKNKYTFPVYLDHNKKVYELFASKYIPRNFVIGKDGKIKLASVGFKQEEFDEMIKLIQAELSK